MTSGLSRFLPNSWLARGIGKHRRAEATLREANAELERRVACRTAELQEEVAQRRRTEETLRASEERWRSMFEASAVGITLTDRHHRFVAANEAFQRMIGYTSAELQSLGPLEITHPEDREASREMIDDVLEGRRSDYHVEQRYLRKDGTVIWVRVSTARATSTRNGLEGIPAIVEDITERKRAQDALHEAREALSRVARLTAMGEMLASIAHEINQPLAAIIANGGACARLLASSAPDLEAARDAVEDIVSDGKRASDVIRRVRGLVKNTAAERAPLDINDTIQEVLAFLRHEVARHRVSVRTELSAGLPSIAADRVQLQQVVLNLVMNGIEAMDAVADRPRILTVRSQLDDRTDVLVSVEDSGVGFDPGDQQRIFDSFFTTKVHGMGMGLAISSSIIEDHRGRLWAAVGSPHGAVFRFTLPATAATA